MLTMLADVGSSVSTPAFWGFLCGCIGAVAGVFGGIQLARADRDRLEEELAEAKSRLAEAYQALGDPEGTERRTADNLRAALDEPYDQDRDAS